MAKLDFSLDDVKPLLSAVGLGQDPTPAPKPVNDQPPPPLQIPPTPAAAGFTEWASDPQNASKVADGITPPGAPLLPPPPQAALGANVPLPPNAPNVMPPQRDTSFLTPPTQAALPTSAPTPAQAQQTNMNLDMAANPDQYQKPGLVGQGWKGLLRFGLPAALVSAGSGLSNMGRGDPTAGLKMIGDQVSHDQNVPASNSAEYRLRNVQPLQDALATQQAGATLAQTKAKTLDIEAKRQQDLSRYGLKVVTDPETGETSTVPDTDSPVYLTNQAKDAKLQAQTDYLGAQEENSKAQKELREAQTAFTNNKSDPDSLVSKQVAQRLATAQRNSQISAGKLSQSQLTYKARYLGTGANGEALPGTMITDDGTPVGSAFSGNVRPTGTERNKGDMANSADTQLADIKSIMQRNPTMFGPGYGQTSEFKKWIGGQSPDAQRFMAARTIAADHLAGTFGGRSEAALTALDNAIGQFKDNPEAAIAGVDQLSGANKSFMQAGAVKTTGSNNAKKTGIPKPPAGGTPAENATKINSHGDKVIFKGGKWGPA